MHEFVTRISENYIWWLFLLMMLDMIGVPYPSEIPLLYAGYLAGEGQLDLAGAIVVATLGAMAGALVLYWASRTFGRAAVLRWGRYIRVTEDQVHRSEAWFARNGSKAVFLCRLIPLARTLISVPAGIAEMRVSRFVAYSIGGVLLWSIALITLGVALGEQWERVLGSFNLAGLVAAGAIAVLLVWWLARRRRAARARAQAPDTEPGSLP